jgi:protoheme IX farnesyltransferase
MVPPAHEAAAAARPARAAAIRPFSVSACAELTKPRLLSLVLVTTFLGYVLAGGSLHDAWRVLATLLGTALVGGGANGLNQWWEAERDGRMRRTRTRPLPSGRVSRGAAFAFSASLSLGGLWLLGRGVNGLTALLAAASWLVYLFAYTPLKPRTPLNTIVGAVSGAIPAAMGWTAATGRLEPGAAVLFAVLFVWQIPHFLSIAWIHRKDYADGGFLMLPVVDPDGRATFRIAAVYSLGLLPVGWAAAFAGLSGWLYLAGSTLLGLGMVVAALRLHRTHTVEAARAVFLASLAYLPGLFLLMVLDPTRLPARLF